MPKNDPYSKITSGQIKLSQAKNMSVRLPQAVQKQNRESPKNSYGGTRVQKDR